MECLHRKNILDALHPDKLREIVREAIERHIPAGYMDALNVAEESERSILERMAKAAGGLTAEGMRSSGRR